MVKQAVRTQKKAADATKFVINGIKVKVKSNMQYAAWIARGTCLLGLNDLKMNTLKRTRSGLKCFHLRILKFLYIQGWQN